MISKSKIRLTILSVEKVLLSNLLHPGSESYDFSVGESFRKTDMNPLTEKFPYEMSLLIDETKKLSVAD